MQHINTLQSPIEGLLNAGDLDFDTAGKHVGTFSLSAIADPHDIIARIQPHLVGFRPPGGV